jgi:putative transposase
MPRHARIVVPGLPHQVGTRGNNKRRLFSYASDYRRFIGFLRRALIDSGCQMHQLTLMPNHLHMIATPPNGSALSDLMKWALGDYARTRNSSRDSCGKLFEQRFFSAVIDDPSYLARATLYNDSNMAQARLVDDPLDHKWSTCAIHAGEPERSAIPLDMWTPSTWYLSLGTPAERGPHYRELLANYLATLPAEADPDLVEFVRRVNLRERRRIERPDGSSAREAKSAVWLRNRKGSRG